MSEFKKLKNDEEVAQEIVKEIQFTREPIIVDCKYCKSKILTDVDHETTYTGIIISIILLLLLNIFAIPLILILIPLTKNSNHRCPSCLNKIGECNFYDRISLSDKVISLTLGSFAIVISKKHLLGIFTFILLLTIFILEFKSIDTSRLGFIDESFDDFYKTCNPEKYSNRRTHTETSLFCSSYRYSKVQWDGYVVRVDYDNSFFAKYRISILVKMRVEDKSQDGDLYLKITDRQYNQLKDVIYEINRGIRVEFNATIISEGNERSVPILDAFGLEIFQDDLETISKDQTDIKENKINIDAHIHHEGRYSLDNQQLTHKDHIIHSNENLYDNMNDFITEGEVNLEDDKETYH